MLRRYLPIFVILSIMFLPFYSIVSIAEPLETNEFSDTNVFIADGYLSHYYIERFNSSLTGEVYIYHPENSFDLTIHTTNIKDIVVDVQSLYDDEGGRAWNTLPSDFRAWIISNSKYNITFKSDGKLSSVGFVSAENLEPIMVSWNGEEIGFTKVDENTFTASVPSHGTEENTIVLHYSFDSEVYISRAVQVLWFFFLLALIVTPVVALKKKLESR